MCGRLSRLRIAPVGAVRCPGVIRCPGAVRCCTGAFLVGTDVGCAVNLGAAPHAASPRKTPPGLEGSKGMRALAGAWGVLCFARCRGRLSLGRAHRQSGEAKRPGQDAGRCGEAIDLNGNRAAAQGVKARRRGGASSERRPMQRLKPAAGADSAVATVRGPAGLLAPGASQPRVGRGSPGGRVVRRAAASGAARFVGPRLTSPLRAGRSCWCQS